MTFRILPLFLLLSTLTFAQTRFNALAEIEDIPYASTATIFNGSTVPIYLEALDVSGVAITVCDPSCHPYTPADGPIEFGIAPSGVEGQQCQSVQAFIFGTSLAAPSDGVRVTTQPCAHDVVSYNPTKRCWGFYSVSCSLNLSTAPLIIQPGTGVSVWAERYKNDNAFGWEGKASVGFRWHK